VLSIQFELIDCTALKISSINIFVWSIALLAHACHSFGALFAVRFILGMCEGAITAGFLIVTSMFYTRQEQTVRVGYWCEYKNSYIAKFRKASTRVSDQEKLIFLSIELPQSS
jgi:hypothetical protein